MILREQDLGSSCVYALMGGPLGIPSIYLVEKGRMDEFFRKLVAPGFSHNFSGVLTNWPLL